MRPIYETADDRNKEDAIVDLLEAKWSCKFTKIPIRYNLDFVISRNNKVLAYSELKVRKYSMEKIGQMGGYMMSLGKWSAAKQLCEASSLPFMLIVQTLDGLYSMKEKKFIADQIIIGGRADRNDWQDIEPCILLNINRFVKI
jgi:hypothetical protein